MSKEKNLILALPKGRIEKELLPLLEKSGIIPEEAFFNPMDSRLIFSTNRPEICLVRVRAFDVVSFVAFGAAHMGICGRDVTAEFNYEQLYIPLDLNIGKCRMAVAQPHGMLDSYNPQKWSHIRVATKYPNVTRQYFLSQGVQAECIKLHGSVELAPLLGLCESIVDLVSTGATLKANNLVEVEKIADITSCLVVNRAALKTRSQDIKKIIALIEKALYA